MGETQKGMELKDKMRLLGKYKGLSPPEVLAAAKQMLAALASRLGNIYQRGRGKDKCPVPQRTIQGALPAPVQNHYKTRATKSRN